MVSCHNTVSGKSTISIGVPQGSVLGPLLIIYVHDIHRHVHLGACNLYADDTLVYYNGSTIFIFIFYFIFCIIFLHTNLPCFVKRPRAIVIGWALYKYFYYYYYYIRTETQHTTMCLRYS